MKANKVMVVHNHLLPIKIENFPLTRGGMIMDEKKEVVHAYIVENVFNCNGKIFGEIQERFSDREPLFITKGDIIDMFKNQ